MNECIFKPNIIGHDFNNTGLPKKFMPAKNIDTKTSVERRCEQWHEMKK
jgi:hypothetical protein